MKTNTIGDLSRCGEFRQTLESRPPKAVLGTMILLCLLLGTALVWAAFAKADLVVRAPGRVRPAEGEEYKVVSLRRGRIAEVRFKVGDSVKKGAILARLDTERLENDIAKLTMEMEATKEEIRQLEAQERLTGEQAQVAKAKTEAELRRAKAQLKEAQEKRASEIREARRERDDAEAEERRQGMLAKQGIASQVEWNQATSKLQAARERLARAQIPLDDGGVPILERARELVEREYELQKKKLLDGRAQKRAQVEIANKSLANLEIERKESVILSPADGVVIAGEPKNGDLLEPGSAVACIAPHTGSVLEVAILSGDIGDLRVGMETRIRMDAYDHQKFGTVTGRVLFISPDSQRIEGQGAVVYKVRIALDQTDLGPDRPIQLGMTGISEIRTGQESLLSLLVKKIRKGISLS